MQNGYVKPILMVNYTVFELYLSEAIIFKKHLLIIYNN